MEISHLPDRVKNNSEKEEIRGIMHVQSKNFNQKLENRKIPNRSHRAEKYNKDELKIQ